MCVWPRGCRQDAASASPDSLCYYHEKVVAGFVTPDEWFCSPSALLPREQGRDTLTATLQAFSAPEPVVAAVQSVALNPPHWARHGQGYLPTGRVVA